MEYIIKNNSNNMYYKLRVCKNINHFVANIKEAQKYKTMQEATGVLKRLPSIFLDNGQPKYEIIKRCKNVKIK